VREWTPIGEIEAQEAEVTLSIEGHIMPWTEEDYLSLGETPERIELLDGSLYVSPAPTLRHQKISRRLSVALDDPAETAGLEVFEAVNLRLRPDRIVIPDLVINERLAQDGLVMDADVVRLVCEITSPSNAGHDRVMKMHYYASAGIPWYLLIDPDEPTLHLFRLDGSAYREHAVASPGTLLAMTAPVQATIDPASLVK
jgi:Uma2 family endonuclease